jgi:hypothetical protein
VRITNRHLPGLAVLILLLVSGCARPDGYGVDSGRDGDGAGGETGITVFGDARLGVVLD